MVAGLAIWALSGPAAGRQTGSGAQASDQASVSASKRCSWKWKRRKVVRWVRRHGKKKRVVKYRKVKVRTCRTVPDPAPELSRLGVRAWEFGFTLSAKAVPAGDTIIELNNQGEDAHNLHVQRSGDGDDLFTPDTDPGQVNRIRFTTTPGTYRLWCSLPSHAVWGMDTTIVVD